MTIPAAAQANPVLPLSLFPSADSRPEPASGPTDPGPALAESSYDFLVREYGIYDDALLQAVKLLLAHEVHHRTPSALPPRPLAIQAAAGFWSRLVNF